MSIAQPETSVSIPFEVRVRFLTKRELYKLSDNELEKGGYLERSGTSDGCNGHYQRFDIVSAELRRREAVQAERELKRLARMVEAAKAWHAETGAAS